MTLLNLGCGQRYHPDWINIDFVSHAPMVRAYDLTKGIPLADESCDAVYHSHVLEHFDKQQGAWLVAECWRVLKPGGILRVVVPDLEALATQYLAAISSRRQAEGPLTAADHQWATIELMDQLVRTKSGGEMASYWRQPHIINEATLESRLGHEFTAWRAGFLSANKHTGNATQERVSALSGWQRLKQSWRRYWLQRWGLKEADVEMLRFLRAGEKHLWMYDALSLRQLLAEKGFGEIVSTDAFTSRIPGWANYQMLDVEAGKTRKPDSLFMEAVKAGGPIA